MRKASKDHRIYLVDILSAIDQIQDYTSNGRDEFFTSTLVQDAVIRQFSIIGEAARRLPNAQKALYPETPWRKIIGMRNIIIHDYSETDLPTIWDAVEKGLPALRITVESMVKRKAA
jgi:uncharacterized protein with HEPN domain